MASAALQISLFILVIIQCCTAANIMLFFFPIFSHITGPANVAKVLQNQGHNITMVVPPQLKDKLEGKEMNLLVYKSLGDLNVDKAMEKISLEIFSQRKSFFKVLINILNFFELTCDKILRDKWLLEDIQACKPDLIVLDPTPAARLLAIIAYKFDIPFIFMGSIAHPQFSRTPLLPSVVPNKYFGFTDQMMFPQRLLNTLIEFALYFLEPSCFSDVQIYAPEKPYISIRDLHAKALLWIVREDGVSDYNAPSMPNVKRVSHFLTVASKPLPREFQFFMDNAKNGVVVVSFGSIFKSMSSAIVEQFLRAFKKTKYKFVIRHPMLNSSDSDQFLFSNWLPRYDLLCHNNTRLFITHCGSNGQQESLLAGVPMIGFPIFADQPHNAARIVRKGFGLRLDLMSFAEEELVSAIEEVTTNPDYKRRSRKASAIMQAQSLVPPIEESAFWINHVLVFGADHLRSLGQDIPLWQFLGFDVLAVCLLVFYILAFIFIKSIKMLCFCFCKCCQRKEKMKKQ